MGAPELDKDLIDSKSAADILGVSVLTLKRRRFRGYKGPPGPPWYPRWGRIYYKRSEVLAFCLERRTTEAPPDTRLPRLPPAPTSSPT